MKCTKEDCFNCKHPDCINDYVRKPHKYTQYDREYGKKKRDEARAKGICTTCFKEKATHGVLCYECRIRQRRIDRERKKPKGRFIWMGYGKCYFCGNKAMDGYKVCEKHYKLLSEKFIYSRKNEV